LGKVTELPTSRDSPVATFRTAIVSVDPSFGCDESTEPDRFGCVSGSEREFGADPSDGESTGVTGRPDRKAFSGRIFLIASSRRSSFSTRFVAAIR
jgi:hypothetical protein